jgi:hypothetical protein
MNFVEKAEKIIKKTGQGKEKPTSTGTPKETR